MLEVAPTCALMEAVDAGFADDPPHLGDWHAQATFEVLSGRSPTQREQEFVILSTSERQPVRIHCQLLAGG